MTSWRRRLVALAVLLPVALVLPLAALVASRWSPLMAADHSAEADAVRFTAAHAAVRHAARAVTHLGDPVVVTGVTAVLVVALFFRRWLRAAAYVAAVRLVAIVLGFVVKELVGRPRPALPHPLIHASGWSFPSGHALGSAALFASIAVLTASAVGRAWTVAIAVVVPVVVAASRVCLGVHYVSDVGAGLVLGWAVAAVLALAPTMAPTRSG